MKHSAQPPRLGFTGERFVPEVDGNIALEHIHRYLMACKLAKGKVVLDIACGEGYGSAMLADVAVRVIGIDISQQAVTHAAQRYKRSNLEFRVGSCAAIPLVDRSIDLIVSFETIEHHDQHEAMMAEIKRVLSPDGLLIMSSPEKHEYSVVPGTKNPYHIKELYRHEFENLIEIYFKHVAMYGQRMIYGSAIFAEHKASKLAVYRRENGRVSFENRLARPLYLIALAADVEIQDISNGILEQPINESEVVQSWSRVVAEAANNYEKEIQRLSDNLHKLYNSTSWRITRPLRFVKRVVLNSACSHKKTAAEKVLGLALRAYRAKWLAPLFIRVPFVLRRSIRAILLRQMGEPQVRGLPVQPNNTYKRDSQGGSRKVSIIIPVFNHAEHLKQCIDSAVNQTWPDVEVVIVDDASSDPRVREILRHYEAHSRVKLFYNAQNLGISLTQNRALTETTGEIIGFLDCDDYLAPDAVEICMAHWHDRIVYSHSGRVNVDESGQEISRINFVSLPRRDYFHENLHAMYATHFKMVRRDVFAKVGLFDSRFNTAQDYDLLMRVAFHYPSTAFFHIPDFVYFHRLHNKQTTGSMNVHQKKCTVRIQEEARLREAIRNGCFDKFISIIMLSFGKHTQTREAIKSIEATVRIPHEIILFDNGSDKSTVEFIRNEIDGKFNNVRVFFSSENLGPAAGRREALKHAKGDWFVIFDNDEVAENGWIEELIVRSLSQDKVGSVSCKVIFPNNELQFTGGYVEYIDDRVIKLELYDRGKYAYSIETAAFRECEWNPIGATLFTINPLPYLHEGYPNVFEDAGVSFALHRAGYTLLNSPASWVWHHHVSYRNKVDMKKRYLNERYNPKLMLKSISSFYQENGLIIFDEYVWRENKLFNLNRAELLARLSPSERARKFTVEHG